MEFFESLKQGKYGSLELNRLVGPTLFQAFGFAVLIHFLAVMSPILYNHFRPVAVEKTDHYGKIEIIPPLVPQAPTHVELEPVILPNILTPTWVKPVATDKEPVETTLPADQKGLKDFYNRKVEDYNMSGGGEGGPIIVQQQFQVVDDVIPPPRDFIPVEVYPQALSNCPQPVFPELAKIAKLPGKVSARVYIDKTGTVKKYFIESASPKGLGFEEEVLKVVPLWKFTPAIQDKHPIGVWISIPFKFTLK